MIVKPCAATSDMTEEAIDEHDSRDSHRRAGGDAGCLQRRRCNDGADNRSHDCADAATAAANVPAVVCVGEATTYLDWLNGEFLPTIRTRLKPPADPTGDLLATIQERGILRVSTDKDYAPQSFLEPDGSFVGFRY